MEIDKEVRRAVINSMTAEEVGSAAWNVMHNGVGNEDAIDDVVARVLSNYVNVASFNRKDGGVAGRMARDHPTLQQNFMRTVVVPFMKAMATSRYVDLRNEGSHNLAKKVMPLVEEAYLPFV